MLPFLRHALASRRLPSRDPGPGPAAGVEELGLQLQPPQSVAPHALEHSSERPESITIRSIESVSPAAPQGQQTRVGEPPQVLGDGAERDVRHRPMDVARLHLAGPDQADDLATPGRGEHGHRRWIRVHRNYFSYN